MNCGPSNQALDEPRQLLRDRSEFGDNRSVGESHSTHGTYRNQGTRQFQTEQESDYDNGATGLYRCIEGKDWDGALSRLELAPIETKTWVSRREAGTDKIRWRLLPLHAVCIFRAPLALIEALIEVYPDGTKMKDDQGMLPVHLACRNGASKGVVLTLLAAFPDSINIRDRKNRLPVDLVEASNSQNKENVLAALKKFQRDMIKMNYMAPPPPPQQDLQMQESTHSASQSQINMAIPTVIIPTPAFSAPAPVEHNVIMEQREAPRETREAPRETPKQNMVFQSTEVKEVDYEHRTILFRMILKKDWPQACSRAMSFPTEASTWIVTKGFNGNLRFLPLHKACVLQPPSNVIDALLEAYPDGAEAMDQDGWLPIHCACFYGASADVINSLLIAYARGATQKDEEGRLPLHYACLKGASKELVDVLLATSSKSAMAKDDEGRLPIHHACGKGAPEEVIDALLKASPKGAQSKDDQGRLPLHHACRKSTSERVIRTLLRVYPRAAQIKDDQDKLAVHYACQHGASAAIIHLLLSTYPESINLKNAFGQTPIADVKAANNPNKDQVVKLMEKFKETHEMNSAATDSSEYEEKFRALQSKVTSLERTLSKIGDVGRGIKSELRRGKEPAEILEDLADRLLLLGNAGGSAGGSTAASTTPSTATPLGMKQASVTTNTPTTTPVKQVTTTPAKMTSTMSKSSVVVIDNNGRTSSAKQKRSTTPSRGLFGRGKKVTNQ